METEAASVPASEIPSEASKKAAEDNTIRVSRGRRVNVYTKRMKRLLQSHPKVILQGLGKAIISTVELSQFVVHNMDCKIIKIQTQTTADRLRKKKIIIEVAPTKPIEPEAKTSE
mmetsp:Transcript_3065/g.4568  ORF Transcript_3065/g.4568 Transcript_3065/m.4568 type:complete len:115 (+) Transcript_3065:39-383(+)